MVDLQELQKISSYEWEIPASFRSDMLVPVRIFASLQLLQHIAGDHSLDQAVNVATLPGVVDKVVIMPDMHQGYGFPIGAVAAIRYPDGVISPGGIGYDINCGVRLLASSIPAELADPYLPTLANLLDQYCPSGVGKSGAITIGQRDMDRVMYEGAGWAFRHGYATNSDISRTEESGCLSGAHADKVSKRARERGRTQIGSVGSGNHFIEVDRVDDVFDEQTAQIFGLIRGCLVVQIHCGSRGLGHQVCTDFVREYQGVIHRYGIDLPDRELVCAPLDSPEGLSYLGAMRAAANFAFVNRQLLTHQCRRAFRETFAGKVKYWQLTQVYDVCHNIGKIETHQSSEGSISVCVHRKGATRAFGPASVDLPPEFNTTGQPVLVPGSMGSSSWVLTGTSESMLRSWGSCCHGAGRRMSRTQAKKEIRGETLRRELEKGGMQVRAGSLSGLAEEAPLAYKDVDEVVETAVVAGLARKVARLRPLVVIKG